MRSNKPRRKDRMRAAIYSAPDRLSVQTVPSPRLQPGDVLLRMGAASICATDLKILAYGHFKLPPGAVRVLGHELAGEVLEAPDGTVAPGTRVGVVPNFGCGRCEECLAGLDHLCRHYEALGITVDGGFADYVRIPAAAVRRGNLISLPDRISLAEAALVEPMSCVVNAHDAVGTAPGDRVLILGAGPMGAMHVVMARLRGAALVAICDPWPDRRQRARMLGADTDVEPDQMQVAIDRLTAGRGFDVVIVAAPSPQAQSQAIASAAVRGRVNFFAGLPASSPAPALPVNLIHYRQLVVTGTTGSSVPQYRRTVALVAAERLDLRPFISIQAPLARIEAVVETVRQKKVLKAVLFPDNAGSDADRRGSVRSDRDERSDASWNAYNS